MNNQQISNHIITLSQEDAEASVDQMTDVQRSDLGSVQIISGKHARHGNIYIVIPCFGDSHLLLPFETQAS